MLKRSLLFFGFFLLAFAVFIQGNQLLLAFYIFFPFLLFPLLDFLQYPNRFFFFASVLVVLAIYGLFLSREADIEIVLFGLGYAGMLFMLFTYRKSWSVKMEQEAVQANIVGTELKTLKEKYQLRLDSLHHLEKQVSSLLDLFEIARDFSECLSFEAMSELLFKKVLPILPFQSMRFILMAKPQAAAPFSLYFVITPGGVESLPPEFGDAELLLFSKVIDSKQVLKIPVEGSSTPNQGKWIFPLMIEGEVNALLGVEAASAEDLVKFEVLVAHLVLQVKKIRLYETVKELSIIDGLTGVYVRRYFLERFHDELKRSVKYQLPLAVLMLDIDHFKRYNDELGHLVGDATLKEVSALLLHSLRKVDIVARYGGEEFIAVLPETHPEGAMEVAERIRSNIARHTFRVYDAETKVTLSIGVTFFPVDLPKEKRESYYPDLAFDLILHADKALYRAKDEGRNRIFRFQDL